MDKRKIEAGKKLHEEIVALEAQISDLMVKSIVNTDFTENDQQQLKDLEVRVAGISSNPLYVEFQAHEEEAKQAKVKEAEEANKTNADDQAEPGELSLNERRTLVRQQLKNLNSQAVTLAVNLAANIHSSKEVIDDLKSKQRVLFAGIAEVKKQFADLLK